MTILNDGHEKAIMYTIYMFLMTNKNMAIIQFANNLWFALFPLI